MCYTQKYDVATCIKSTNNEKTYYKKKVQIILHDVEIAFSKWKNAFFLTSLFVRKNLPFNHFAWNCIRYISYMTSHHVCDSQTETSLLYDAVHLFAKALHDLDTSQQIDIKPLSCESTDTWPHGYSLINYMKIVSNINWNSYI